MIKKYLSQLKLPQQNKFPLKSYPTLFALFVLGLMGIASIFYSFYDFKVGQLADFDLKTNELEAFMAENQEQKNRLEIPAPPNQAEAMSYAKKVPMEREVPRFLLELDNIAKLSGVDIKKLTVNEREPEQRDLVTIFLKELGTLAKDLKEQSAPNQEGEKKEEGSSNPFGLSGIQQRERVFVTDPEKLLEGYFKQSQSVQDEQQEEQGATEIPPELVEYIPFGMIHFHVETQGTFHQLSDFLGLLRTAERLVHVEKWEYRYPEANEENVEFVPQIIIDFKIFYYKEKIKDIPQLPALEIKEDDREQIITVPKTFLETQQQVGSLNPSEGTVSSGSLESIIPSYSQESITKD